MSKKNLLFLPSIAAIAFILFQPYLTWFYADDYCLIPKLQSDGIFKCMIDDYLKWDGRSLSVSYIISRLGLKYEIYWLGPLLGTFLMLGASYLLAKLYSKNLKVIIYISINICIIIWLGSLNFISQTLYWSTGIGYTFEMFAIILGAYFLHKSEQKWYVYIVFFIIGSFSPNAVIAIITVLSIQIFYNIIVEKSKSRQEIKYIFIILIGLLIVILTPGNGNRMPSGNEIRNNLTNPIKIYSNLKWLSESIVEFNTPIVWILLLIGLLGVIVSNETTEVDHKVHLFRSIVKKTFQYRWLIAAIISVYAFMPIPGFYAFSPRVNIHFFSFILIFSVTSSINVTTNVNFNILKQISFILINFFLIVISIQSYDAYISKKRMINRVSYYRENKGKDVRINLDQLIRGPLSRKFHDVENDSTYWLNIATSEYFGLKSIKLDLTTKNN